MGPIGAKPRALSALLLDIAGTPTEIATDSEDLARFLSGLWSASSPALLRRDHPPRRYAVRIAPDIEGVFEGPTGSRPLDRRRPVVHAYQLILNDVLGARADCFAFHAACVARGGRALIVSGPSTLGKTTLSVNLAARGFELVSDDLTLLDRATGRVLPTGRAVNLRAGTLDSLPPVLARRARGAIRMRRGRDWAVDPARCFGRPGEVTEVGMVVLLRTIEPPGAIRRITRVTVQIVEGAGEVWPALEASGAVTALRVDDSHPWVAHAEVRDARAFDDWHRAHADRIVSVVKSAAGAPDFSRRPVLTAMGRFEAAVELCQEMVNRHPGSLVEREFRGRGPALVAEAASHLGRARCYGLHAGRLADTLDVLDGAFGALPQRSES